MLDKVTTEIRKWVEAFAASSITMLITAMWIGAAAYVASQIYTTSSWMGGVAIGSFILGMFLLVGLGEYSKELNSRQMVIVRSLSVGLIVGFAGFLYARYYVGGMFALVTIISITLGALTLRVASKLGSRDPGFSNG